jgi:hypothetical protein
VITTTKDLEFTGNKTNIGGHEWFRTMWEVNIKIEVKETGGEDQE